jgi:hypothetical protein
MKPELLIYRAVFIGFGERDPLLPDEPEFERTQVMFYWLEHFDTRRYR